MELAAPITIYWDLPAQAADGSRLLRICADIVACRPLMLQLRYPGEKIGAAVYVLLERLRGVPIAVSLTVSPVALDSAAMAILRDAGLKEILLDVDDAKKIPREAHRPAAGVSYTVKKENWRELPALVTLLRKRGISRLVLPMQRLYNGEKPFFLKREEQHELAAALSRAGGGEGLDPTIHDPFLWRAFNPGAAFPQGGCQAANTMIAVAPDGGVYPCPSLPVLLGSIDATSLKEIIDMAAKKEFRRGLLAYPGECLQCAELAECRGGCRGRACAVHGSINRADPACG